MNKVVNLGLPSPIFRMMALALFAVTCLSTSGIVHAQEPGRDHPLVGRYEGSKMEVYKQSDFDEAKLLNRIYDEKSDGLNADNSLIVQGKTTRIRYTGPKGRSALEVFKNYESGLLSKGFTIIYSCALEACMARNSKSFYRLGGVIDSATKNASYQNGLRHMLLKLGRPAGDVYVSVTVGEWTEPIALINVVELKPMETDKIAFVDASKMEADINSQGKVALYGILFDTGSDKLKSDSDATLAEIAKLLQKQSGLSIVVTGHTDNQGEFGFNVDLSNRRAAAVKAALVGKHGVQASRLTSFGAGMAAPVASNGDEAGRSKNRRVELVRR